MQILLFGQLTDITGSQTVEVTDAKDTDALLQEIQSRYPALANIKYVVAINQKIVTENTLIGDTATIALLPPFSGG